MESQPDASSVRQKLIEKSVENAELKQANDNLRYKLEEAERKDKLTDVERAATQEKMKELYDMVHSLQQMMDGGAIMDEEHTVTVEHGNIKRTIDQAKETIDSLSQKCKTLNQVIEDLEGGKALQEVKIESCRDPVPRVQGGPTRTVKSSNQNRDIFIQENKMRGQGRIPVTTFV
jgi:regulator of replication initiation timing